MSRRTVGLALVSAFVVVPLAELYVIIRVGHVIGILPTIALLLVESLLGGWLVRREGLRTWRALRTALGESRLPDRELADGALVLVGGTLLLAPGFLTDVVGFFLVLPPTRPLARRWLLRLTARRFLGSSRWAGVAPLRTWTSSRTTRRPPSGSDGGRQVIRGEIVDGDDR